MGVYTNLPATRGLGFRCSPNLLTARSRSALVQQRIQTKAGAARAYTNSSRAHTDGTVHVCLCASVCVCVRLCASVCVYVRLCARVCARACVRVATRIPTSINGAHVPSRRFCFSAASFALLFVFIFNSDRRKTKTRRRLSRQWQVTQGAKVTDRHARTQADEQATALTACNAGLP